MVLVEYFDTSIENLLESEAVTRHYNLFSRYISELPWYQDTEIFDFFDRNVGLHVGSILDLCGGTGLVTERLASRRPDIKFILADISEAMLDRARLKVGRLSNVDAVKANWIDHPAIRRSCYDVIVLKNALHLIEPPHSKLDELVEVSNVTTKLLLVETVSPNEIASEFVRNVFARLGCRQGKVNYFTQHYLKEILGGLRNWNLKAHKYHDQSIDIARWVETKGVSDSARQSTRNFIMRSAADERIRRAMRVTLDRNGAPVEMLRRQGLYVLTRR